jgi:DNA-binding MarR family transcriptional regulator
VSFTIVIIEMSKRLDPYIVEVLMRDLTGHDRQPSAFLVYLYLWYGAGTSRSARVRASHRTIAEATGLSKSAVQGAIRTLTRRRLIQSHRATRTATPEYLVLRPWVRSRPAAR